LSSADDASVWPTARTRLFLSADIAGSTAYKQRTRDGSTKENWAQTILSFYTEFGLIFRKKLALTEDRVTAHVDYEKCKSPLFWKAIGDEVLFCVELVAESQAYVAVGAWVNAAREYKLTLRKHRLDLKLAAWVATFPTPNYEVVLPRAMGQDNAILQVADDALLSNGKALKQYYASNGDKLSDLNLDFIGPAMDTGFRIAQQSTTRRMAITPELARVIALSSDLHTDIKDDEKLKLRYGGRAQLKGIGDATGYPMFWVDVASTDDDFVHLEDQLSERRKSYDDKDIIKFVEAYLKDFAPFNCTLYFPKSQRKEFSTLTAELEGELNQIRSIYSREEERLRSELDQADVTPETNATVSSSDLSKLVDRPN
jgi:hypothetical protein